MGGNSEATNGRRIGGDGGDGGPGGDISGVLNSDEDHLIGGIHVGYNWLHRDLLLGLEGDLSLNDNLDDYMGTLRGRIGLIRGDLLLYLTGGFAFRDGDQKDVLGLASAGGDGGDGGTNDDAVDDPDSEQADEGGVGGAGGLGGAPSVAGASGSRDLSETGFVVGTGLEYMLSRNVSAGIEGLWYSFDGDDDMTVIRGRLTMHLNGPEYGSLKDGFSEPAIANWSGFYLGGNLGGAFGQDDWVESIRTADGSPGVDGRNGALGNTDVNGDVPVTDGIDDPGGGGGGGGGGAAALVSYDDGSAFLGGLFLGHNWQDGSRVFGFEGDANWSDHDVIDYLATLRLRLGYAFDQSLIYGTAGLAFAGRGVQTVSLTDGGDGGDGQNGSQENNIEAFNDDLLDPDKLPTGDVGGRGGAGGAGGTATVTSGDSGNEIGFVIGGGFETKLTDRASFGVEGLYYAFDGDDSYSDPLSFTESDDLSNFVVRGRLTFHLTEERTPLK